MKTIRKYPLSNQPFQELQINSPAEIICVEIQFGQLTLWAKADSNRITIRKKIHTIGTGDPVPEDKQLRYISTVQQDVGFPICHIFEEIDV